MEENRKDIFLKYINYLCDNNGRSFEYTGKYVKYVRDFLENAVSINRKGYNLYKKTNAYMFAQCPLTKDAICDFLSFIGVGYQKKKQLVKDKPLEKLSSISEKNNKIMNEFISSLMDEFDYSPNTLSIYSSSIKKFFEYSNEFSLESCRRFIVTLEDEGLSPKTIRLRITSLEKLGDYLKKPVKLKRPKFKRTLETNNIPTEQEYIKLLSYLSGRKNRDCYFFIKILASTGARISEFFEFRWEDVLAGEVTIKGKGNKYRRFFFNSALQKEVKKYINEENKTGYIAVGRFGRLTQRGICQQMKVWGEKCGIDRKKMHPHAFRHFFAKMFLKKTNDVIQLADLLGHGSVDTTRIYLQKSYDEQKRDFNKNVTW